MEKNKRISEVNRSPPEGMHTICLLLKNDLRMVASTALKFPEFKARK